MPPNEQELQQDFLDSLREAGEREEELQAQFLDSISPNEE